MGRPRASVFTIDSTVGGRHATLTGLRARLALSTGSRLLGQHLYLSGDNAAPAGTETEEGGDRGVKE